MENTNVICYMSNALDFRRVYNKKNCNLSSYDIDMRKNQDLVIKGLGFITFKKNCHITLWLLDGISYLIRDSII